MRGGWSRIVAVAAAFADGARVATDGLDRSALAGRTVRRGADAGRSRSTRRHSSRHCADLAPGSGSRASACAYARPCSSASARARAVASAAQRHAEPRDRDRPAVGSCLRAPEAEVEASRPGRSRAGARHEAREGPRRPESHAHGPAGPEQGHEPAACGRASRLSPTHLPSEPAARRPSRSLANAGARGAPRRPHPARPEQGQEREQRQGEGSLVTMRRWPAPCVSSPVAQDPSASR